MNKTRGRAVGLLLGGLLLIASGCARDDSGLVVTGSSTMAPVIADIAERYEQKTGIQVDVQGGGTGRGINDVREGLADVGMASRALYDDETDLVAREVAADGIALIVNAANPIGALSADQVRAIYRGETTRWKAVGGPDAPITVVNKAEGRSTLDLFLHHFDLDNRNVAADVVIGENQQGIKTVAGNEHALGYVSIGAAEYETEADTAIRVLPLGGVAATTANVANKRYPLRRELNLVTVGKPSAAARKFEAFADSPAMDPVYRDHYYVPVDN